MLGRRLLIFVAVLMGLAALAAAVAPRDAAFTPEVREPVPAAPQAPADPPVQRLDAGGSGQAVEAAAGERIRLEVTSAEPVTVQVGEGRLVEAAAPAAPARFSLRYEEAAEAPVRVLGAGPGEARIVGVVRVR